MNYRLTFSHAAREDMLSIGRYTEETWGLKQRDTYLGKMFAALERLRKSPLSGKQRDEIVPGIRSIHIEKHMVFYLMEENEIRIAGVLHERMDPALHLS